MKTMMPMMPITHALLACGLLAQAVSARLQNCLISAPDAGLLYSPGDAINFSGGCTDADGIPMPDSLLAWSVEYRLDSGTTAHMPETRGVGSGTFTTRSVEGAGAPWYRIRLKGGTGPQTAVQGIRDVLPLSRKSEQAYLSDLDWQEAGNGWGPVEKDRSNGETAPDDGMTLSIRFQGFAKGFGVHAPSEIKVPLKGQCYSLVAEVGADDEVMGGGSVAFRVKGDGTVLKQSPVLRGEDPIHLLEMDVSGRQELGLEVTDGGDGAEADHASWGGIRAICKAGFAPAVSLGRAGPQRASRRDRFTVSRHAGPDMLFRFDLEKAGEAYLELRDAEGRLLAASERRALPAGVHQWNWSPKGVRMGNGLHFAVLRIGDGSRVRKLAAVPF